MPTFQTKPRTIQAVQWIGQPISELPLWAQDPQYLTPSGTALYAYTKNGPVRVNCSDWLIGGDKEIYPCTDEEFQKRYDPVEPNALELGAAVRRAGLAGE